MKNTEQIAETVLRIRDAEQKKLIIRNQRLKRVTAGASSILVFCAAILAVRNLNSFQGNIPTIDNHTVIHTETPATSSDTDNSTNENTGTDHSTNSTENAVKESTSAESPETSAHTTEKEASESTGNSSMETSDHNTEPTEQKTTDSGSEAVTIPRWDERTLPTQFMEFDFNSITYSTRDHSIEENHIGSVLGTVTVEGQDVYEDKIHSINAEVFNINSISSNCAVAVKFNGYDSYYVYTNRSYSPSKLGELVDALNLNDTISFGALTPDDRTIVTDYDKSIMSGLLDEYRDCATLFDYAGNRKLFSVSASVEMLGISNKSFAVTEDGYITTNIMEWGYAFYIGEDKAKEIADRLGIDNIERDTTPQVFDPQEEVLYEE